MFIKGSKIRVTWAQAKLNDKPSNDKRFKPKQKANDNIIWHHDVRDGRTYSEVVYKNVEVKEVKEHHEWLSKAMVCSCQ